MSAATDALQAGDVVEKQDLDALPCTKQLAIVGKKRGCPTFQRGRNLYRIRKAESEKEAETRGPICDIRIYIPNGQAGHGNHRCPQLMRAVVTPELVRVGEELG